MRLDLFLAERGMAKSRTEAKVLITEGYVTVNGIPTKKPALDVTDVDNVTVDNSKRKYVSRGGFKLEYALEHFKVDVKDRLAIDVGASSGGFTDCLLQRGAKHVIAIDSGSGQLYPTLLDDGRVTSK